MFRFNIYKVYKDYFHSWSKWNHEINRDVVVTLKRKISWVEKAKCSFPAGASSHCNHIMTLLFEIVDYSLKGSPEVPQEVSLGIYIKSSWQIMNSKWIGFIERTNNEQGCLQVCKKKSIQKKLVQNFMTQEISLTTLTLVANLKHWRLHWESKLRELLFHIALLQSQKEN